MPEAIRDRRPTQSDADKAGEVETWNADRWIKCRWDSSYVQKLRNPWRIIDQTPPPEKLVSKRKTHRRVCGGETIHYIEVLPGDPPDWDAFIEQAVRIFELTNPLIELDERELGIARMRFDKARHGEGSDA